MWWRVCKFRWYSPGGSKSVWWNMKEKQYCLHISIYYMYKAGSRRNSTCSIITPYLAEGDLTWYAAEEHITAHPSGAERESELRNECGWVNEIKPFQWKKEEVNKGLDWATLTVHSCSSCVAGTPSSGLNGQWLTSVAGRLTFIVKQMMRVICSS